MLTLATPAKTGTTFVPVAATATTGDTFSNSGREFFYIKNASVSSITVTFDSPGTCNFELAANSAHDLVVTVPAATEKLIGPFSQTRFNDATGRVTAICSAVTTVTVGVIAAASNA